AIAANTRQRLRMIDKIVGALDGEIEGRSIAVLGLAFKPETDDMREAPSVDIIRGLLERGATIRAFDPAAMAEAGRMIPEMTLCKDAYEACDGADALVIVTEWNQFRMLDLGRVKDRLGEPRMIDLRNIYDAERMKEAGFLYWSVGR
ncbi:MAG TPA: UDP binding domain-containing protein, partial [Myxococcota bacterium]|nr:UDP binding domain-containing protein [Myxococcota bacterium]